MKHLRTLLPLVAILFAAIIVGPIPRVFSSTLALTVSTSKNRYIVTEEIVLHGSLAYDGMPIQDWSVALEVKDPYGTTLVTRTPQTDANGEYDLTFYLPLNARIGVYTVYVGSNYKGATAMNSTTFELMPRDLTVTDCTLYKNVTGQGYCTNITVAVENRGYPVETFNVTVFGNASVIATREITLMGGNSITLTFTWNTSSFAKGTYIIRGYITPVPGETDTANNMYDGDSVIVTVPGDVDATFTVTILDVVKITGIYASKQGDPNFNPNSDINNDGKITILDVVICTGHYGQKHP